MTVTISIPGDDNVNHPCLSMPNVGRPPGLGRAGSDNLEDFIHACIGQIVATAQRTSMRPGGVR